MKSRREPELTISEQAARWLVVLMDADAVKTATFVGWLKQSPRHVEEFLFATATWRQLCDLGVRMPIDLEAILAEVRTSAESNVVALPMADPAAIHVLPGQGENSGNGAAGLRAQEADEDTPPSIGHFASRRWRGVRWAAGVAALGLTALLAWFALSFGPTYSTDIGEQRTVRLEDGSVVYLNTDTKARVRFTASHRDIELLEGEALFVVAHDSGRPFRVRTRDAVVQAIGTQFNVRRYARDTRVSVVEGRVRIARHAAALADPSESTPTDSTAQTPPRTEAATNPLSSEVAATLAAGEGATIGGDGQVSKSKSVDIAQAVAWRERRLVFRADRLEDVVTEVNRYSARHFRVEGALARDTRLTATFDVDKPESLAAFLEQYSDLAVDRHDGEFVIRAR